METPQFELIDPRPLAPERYLEIAKWHDCMHPVAASDPPLEEEWYRVNDLINALAEATSRATKAESRAEGLLAELAEQETAALGWAKEIDGLNACRAALQKTVDALADSYDVNEWPGHAGDAAQAMYEAREVLAKTAAPTPPPSSPAAAGPGILSAEKLAAFGYEEDEPAAEPWRAVYPTEADYDASVARNVERIKSGEVKPIEQEEEEEEVCRCSVAIWQTDVEGRQRCNRCNLLAE